MNFDKKQSNLLPKEIDMIDCEFDGAPIPIYLIKGEQWALIDTGVSDTPERFIFPYLSELGKTPKDVSMIIHTHGHQDHFGGNGQFVRSNPDVQIMIHGNDLEWAENHRRYFNELFCVFPGEWEPNEEYKRGVLNLCGSDVPVTRVLKDEDEIYLGNDITLKSSPVPAHSPGHVMLYIDHLNTAFVGDAVQWKGTILKSGTIVFPLYHGVETYMNSLNKIKEFHAEYLCTGHFWVLDAEKAEYVIKESENFVHNHNQRIMDTLQHSAKPLGLHELASILHQNHYQEYEFAFQIHATTHAHCQYLREQGFIERVSAGKHLMWKVR